MLSSVLAEHASAVAAHLIERGQSIGVAESAAGGLISAALVAVPGASAYYRGGLVIYTVDGAKELLAGLQVPADVRGASEPFARWLATSAATKLTADWGIGETGAAGPAGNPYGDPPGHAWVAVCGPDGAVRAHQVLTGTADRERNMEAFAAAGLMLVLATIAAG
jgi:PncC family amidohydrolase